MNKKPGRRIIEPPSDFNPTGFCECGCGQKTPIAKQTSLRRSQYRGYPIRYIQGHNQRGKSKPNTQRFKIDKAGYRLIYLPGHHLANNAGYVVEHRLLWESYNGRRLHKNEEVHHIDGNPSNNAYDNLVALTKKEHQQIHSAKNGFIGKKEAHRRRTQNPEYRKNHSEAMIKWWANRKARKEQDDVKVD